MQNLRDLHMFTLDENFLKIQEESINYLLNDQNIIKTIKKYNLNKEDVKNNWADFLSYQEDLATCLGCISLQQCPKVSKGMQYELSFEQGQSSLSLKLCKYGKEHFENQNILNNILLKNVDEKVLLTKMSDLTMVLQTGGNVRDVIALLDAYIDAPSGKGFYIHGAPGIGKSTLMGWLTRALTSKGYPCGYIHFPTFLIDLKNSFGENGIYDSIELMKNLDYLIIDDIGGENVTPWSRDEILSAILAYRGQSEKATFFTSIYSLDELGKLYVLKNGDNLRVKRVIERMKAVSKNIELKGKALR